MPAATVWYNISTGVTYYGQGTQVSLPAPLDIINVLVFGGSIIPMQDPAFTTVER